MEEEMKVKLFGVWSSPYSRRIEIALKMKEIPYEYIEEDLSNKSSQLIKYNPVYKKIPVLVHSSNQQSIVESLIILEYIDETWNHHPILPTDPFERAQARFWAKFIDDQLMPSVWRFFLSNEDQRDKNKTEAFEMLRTFENELKEKTFFGGNVIGYVDIVGLVVAFWVERVQQVVNIELLNQQKFPVLCRWVQRLHQNSLLQECLPPKDEHLAYIRTRYETAITKD